MLLESYIICPGEETTVRLDIQDSAYTLKYYRLWAGLDRPILFTVKGTIESLTSEVKMMHVVTVNDQPAEHIGFSLFKLQEPVDFIKYDHEYAVAASGEHKILDKYQYILTMGTYCSEGEFPGLERLRLLKLGVSHDKYSIDNINAGSAKPMIE